MATVFCSNCGAEADDVAKFCRRCGYPTDPLEAATRALEPAAEAQARTRPTAVGATGPAYLAPDQAAPIFAASPTQALQQSSGKKALIVAATLIGLIMVVLAAFAILGWSLWSHGPQRPAAIGSPPPAPGPPIPPQAPAPAEPPELPASGGARAVSKGELIYPGADIRMDIGSEEVGLLQLRTRDPVDKVIDWYVEKLKPSKKVRITGSNAVLQTPSVSVFITSADRETNILIKRGPDRE